MNNIFNELFYLAGIHVVVDVVVDVVVVVVGAVTVNQA